MSRWSGLSDHPWASGFASFVTTVLVLLPLEYEAPLRSFMFFVSARRF